MKTGLESLIEQEFAPLREKRVGLITNSTGITSGLRSAIDVLASAPGVKLTALFGPKPRLPLCATTFPALPPRKRDR